MPQTPQQLEQDKLKNPFSGALPGQTNNAEQSAQMPSETQIPFDNPNAGQPPVGGDLAGQQIPLGNPNAPLPPVAGNNPNIAGGAPPAANDFPSLPPGATPPPGYFDPISGKTAPLPGQAPPAAPTPTSAPPAAPGTPPAAPGAPPPAAPGTSAGPGLPPVPPKSPIGRDMVDNEILRKLLEGDENIDMSNPAIAQQMDAFAAGRERSRRNSVDSDAERLAAQGMGSSGAMDVERRMENEDSAQDTAQFSADLAGRELQQQRDEYQRALDQAVKLGLADQEAALRERIANLDATIRNKQIDVSESLQRDELKLRDFLGREGLSLQKLLGMGDLDLRRTLGMAGINLESFKALMQNDQFLKDLGFRIGSKEADLNGQAGRALLEG